MAHQGQFRVGTPGAMERASLQEQGRPDARTIMKSKPLEVKIAQDTVAGFEILLGLLVFHPVFEPPSCLCFFDYFSDRPLRQVFLCCMFEETQTRLWPSCLRF